MDKENLYVKVSVHKIKNSLYTNAYKVTITDVNGVTQNFDVSTNGDGYGLWINNNQVLGTCQFDAGSNAREAIRRYFASV